MKKKILIVLAIFFFILLIILNSRNGSRNNLQNKNNTEPTTPSQVQVLSLEVENILPAQDKNSQYLPIQFVTFTFNLQVSPDKFSYRVIPFVETQVKQGGSPNIIIVSPKEKWQEGITTIIVTTETIAANGTRLLTPVTYKLKSALPTGGE